MAEDKEKPDKVASNTEPTAEETVTKKTAKKETQYAEFEEFTDDLSLSDDDMVKAKSRPKTSLPDTDNVATSLGETADVVNNAAIRVNNSSNLINESVASLDNSMNAIQKKQTIIFSVFSILILVVVSIGGVFMSRLQESITQADAITLAVGKKVIHLDTELQRLDEMQSEVISLNETNQRLKHKIDESMSVFDVSFRAAKRREEGYLAKNEAMTQTLNQHFNKGFNKINKSNVDLKDRIIDTKNQVADLGKKVQVLQGEVKKFKDQKLVQKLNALITLEQNKYFEVISAADRRQVSVEAIQYPPKEVEEVKETKESIK
ncbi:MAG TPA: hypothetical protein EYN35_09345 [Methylococcales bacterium]|nr:hypothetical protein [Methylococcales bacterium]HIO45662.1 hypothetical protein [Methylococcales bacterium]